MKFKKPDYRIVHVENDPYNGSYYKIETRAMLGYKTYYFRVHNSIYFDQTEYRFKTFEAAKEELDMLIQGKSKYNCFEKVVYETSSSKENMVEHSA